MTSKQFLEVLQRVSDGARREERRRLCFAFLAIIVILVLAGLSLCSCSSEGINDRINGLPSDDKINAQYEHVSESAPEALKPYFDAKLTQDLNR